MKTDEKFSAVHLEFESVPCWVLEKVVSWAISLVGMKDCDKVVKTVYSLDASMAVYLVLKRAENLASVKDVKWAV